MSLLENCYRGWGAVLVACSLLSLAGCKPDTTAARKADKDAVRALDTKWSEAAAAHDLNAVVSFYAPDAVLLPPDEPLAVDPASIRKSWAGTLESLDRITWQVNKIDVSRSGDLVYLTGAWQATTKPTQGTAATPVTGKLLEVWKKSPDGKWECVADTFNSDAAPQA